MTTQFDALDEIMALSRDVRKPEITSKDLDFMMHERKSISFFFGEVMQGLPISSLFSEVSVLAKAKLYRRYQIHCSWVSFLKYILERNEQFQLKRNLNNTKILLLSSMTCTQSSMSKFKKRLKYRQCQLLKKSCLPYPQ